MNSVITRKSSSVTLPAGREMGGKGGRFAEREGRAVLAVRQGAKREACTQSDRGGSAAVADSCMLAERQRREEGRAKEAGVRGGRIAHTRAQKRWEPARTKPR
jgi:hypothetical protein